MEDEKPILGYYKLRGWAGPIRLLLVYLEIEYVDKVYPVPTPETGQGQWGQQKYSLGLHFPNMPYWIDGQVKLTETKAILKHIARLQGHRKLLGASIAEEGRANMLEEVLWDMWQALTKISLHHTEESKGEFLEEATKSLTSLDRFLRTEEWAVGPQINYVDFLLYEVLVHYQKFDPKLLEPLARCVSYLRRFQAIPAIKKYMNSEAFIPGPCYSYKFKAKL